VVTDTNLLCKRLSSIMIPIKYERRYYMIPSFEKRVRAFAIDTSGAMLMIILALPMRSTFPGLLGNIITYAMVIGAFIGFYLLPYFFSSGQSFGKRIQKIKIVDLEGNDVKLWKILLREIFKVGLSMFTGGLYMIISFFVMNEKTSRTIHDYIFKTKMIDLEKRVRGRNEYFGTSESLRKKGL